MSHAARAIIPPKTTHKLDRPKATPTSDMCQWQGGAVVFAPAELQIAQEAAHTRESIMTCYMFIFLININTQ